MRTNRRMFRRCEVKAEQLEPRRLLAVAMVKEIWSNGPFVPMGDTMYFPALVDKYGWELWKSDGTTSGTVIVKDIQPGNSGFVSIPTEIGGKLLFTADDGVHGMEVWCTDGTPAKTTLVKDIWPGADGARGSLPEGDPGFIDLNGVACFAAKDQTNGWALWKSDGTSAATVMVKALGSGKPDSEGGGPQLLMGIGGTLYFIAGTELWKSDGTPAGTMLVKDFNHEFGWVSGLYAELNGSLFFAEPQQGLWKSDGTPDGTVLVKQLSWARGLSNQNGKLYFQAEDNGDAELWTSDGTTAGTVRVKDINVGESSNPTFNGMCSINGQTYFAADDGVHGYELWKTDGTDAGTQMVKDIFPGKEWGYPGDFTQAGGTLYFRADSADDVNQLTELWKSDGTAAGTVQIKEMEGPYHFSAFKDGIYFMSGRALWKYDGRFASLGVDSTLTIDGTPAADTISISSQSGTIQAPRNGETLAFRADDVKRLDFATGDGGDSIDYSTLTLPSKLVSGAGADTVLSGDGDDTVFPGDGDDSLSLGGGRDSCQAGAGSDTINGGMGSDWLLGEAGADLIFGSGGGDRIDGGDGADLLVGNGGNDRLRGEAGCDRLYGRAGVDRLDGGSGSDRLYGDAGDDFRLDGGPGNDRIDGGAGDDSLCGGSGNDRLTCGGGKDTLRGGKGDDTLHATDSIADLLDGSDGQDVAEMDPTLDTLTRIENTHK